MANVIRILLFYPIHILAALALKIRHGLYDLGWIPSAEASVPLICIGNLELGGSGKTPMADYLLERFSGRYKIAFLSRGYGRESRGFRWLQDCRGPEDSGDEPWFLFRKWGAQTVFAVDENRLRGILNILESYPETDVILLDDAFQHRRIRPSFSFLLTPFKRPFFRNFLFPCGTLRDLPTAAHRASAFIFTKAMQASEAQLRLASESLEKAGFSGKPVFVSSVEYLSPVNHKDELPPVDCPLIAVSGLADNQPFFDYCASEFRISRRISLPDHYAFPPDFFIRRKIRPDAAVLCTEKDFAKILAVAPEPDLVFYLPLRIRIFPETEFIKIIEKQLAP